MIKPRFRSLWLAEVIRSKEATGSLDDEESIRTLFDEQPEKALSAEGLILRRAELLSAKNPIAKAIPTHISFAVNSSQHVLLVLSVISVVMGLLTASSAMGSGNTINIVLVLVALLGPHILSLLWLSLAFLFGRRSARFSLTQFWLNLVKRFGRQHDAITIVESLRTLIRPHVSLSWMLIGVSHFLWFLFACSCFATSLLFMAFREYEFVWRTTILPTEFFIQFVAILGWLPGLMGFGSPGSDDVAALMNVDQTRRAWAGWLLGSLAVYGIVPRAILAGISLVKVEKEARKVSLDLAHPYYVATLNRIHDVVDRRTVITDPDPGGVLPIYTEEFSSEIHSLQEHFAALESPPLTVDAGQTETLSNQHKMTAILPFELQDDLQISTDRLTEGMVLFENLISHEDQTRALDRIRIEGCRRAAFVCDSRTTASRGTFRYLRMLTAMCPEVRVVLLHQDRSRVGKVENWMEGLEEMGVQRSEVTSNLVESLAWLERQ